MDRAALRRRKSGLAEVQHDLMVSIAGGGCGAEPYFYDAHKSTHVLLLSGRGRARKQNLLKQCRQQQQQQAHAHQGGGPHPTAAELALRAAAEAGAAAAVINLTDGPPPAPSTLIPRTAAHRAPPAAAVHTVSVISNGSWRGRPDASAMAHGRAGATVGGIWPPGETLTKRVAVAAHAAPPPPRSAFGARSRDQSPWRDELQQEQQQQQQQQRGYGQQRAEGLRLPWAHAADISAPAHAASARRPPAPPAHPRSFGARATLRAPERQQHHHHRSPSPSPPARPGRYSRSCGSSSSESTVEYRGAVDRGLDDSEDGEEVRLVCDSDDAGSSVSGVDHDGPATDEGVAILSEFNAAYDRNQSVAAAAQVALLRGDAGAGRDLGRRHRDDVPDDTPGAPAEPAAPGGTGVEGLLHGDGTTTRRRQWQQQQRQRRQADAYEFDALDEGEGGDMLQQLPTRGTCTSSRARVRARRTRPRPAGAAAAVSAAAAAHSREAGTSGRVPLSAPWVQPYWASGHGDKDPEPEWIQDYKLDQADRERRERQEYLFPQQEDEEGAFQWQANRVVQEVEEDSDEEDEEEVAGGAYGTLNQGQLQRPLHSAAGAPASGAQDEEEEEEEEGTSEEEVEEEDEEYEDEEADRRQQGGEEAEEELEEEQGEQQQHDDDEAGLVPDGPHAQHRAFLRYLQLITEYIRNRHLAIMQTTADLDALASVRPRDMPLRVYTRKLKALRDRRATDMRARAEVMRHRAGVALKALKGLRSFLVRACERQVPKVCKELKDEWLLVFQTLALVEQEKAVDPEQAGGGPMGVHAVYAVAGALVARLHLQGQQLSDEEEEEDEEGDEGSGDSGGDASIPLRMDRFYSPDKCCLLHLSFECLDRTYGNKEVVQSLVRELWVAVQREVDARRRRARASGEPVLSRMPPYGLARAVAEHVLSRVGISPKGMRDVMAGAAVAELGDASEAEASEGLEDDGMAYTDDDDDDDDVDDEEEEEGEEEWADEVDEEERERRELLAGLQGGRGRQATDYYYREDDYSDDDDSDDGEAGYGARTRTAVGRYAREHVVAESESDEEEEKEAVAAGAGCYSHSRERGYGGRAGAAALAGRAQPGGSSGRRGGGRSGSSDEWVDPQGHSAPAPRRRQASSAASARRLRSRWDRRDTAPAPPGLAPLPQPQPCAMVELTPVQSNAEAVAAVGALWRAAQEAAWGSSGSVRVSAVGGPQMMLALLALHAAARAVDLGPDPDLGPDAQRPVVPFQPMTSAKAAAKQLAASGEGQRWPLPTPGSQHDMFPPPLGVPGMVLLTCTELPAERLEGVDTRRVEKDLVVVRSRKSSYFNKAVKDCSQRLVAGNCRMLRLKAVGVEGLEAAMLVLAKVRTDMMRDRRDLAAVLHDVMVDFHEEDERHHELRVQRRAQRERRRDQRRQQQGTDIRGGRIHRRDGSAGGSDDGSDAYSDGDDIIGSGQLPLTHFDRDLALLPAALAREWGHGAGGYGRHRDLPEVMHYDARAFMERNAGHPAVLQRVVAILRGADGSAGQGLRGAGGVPAEVCGALELVLDVHEVVLGRPAVVVKPPQAPGLTVKQVLGAG